MRTLFMIILSLAILAIHAVPTLAQDAADEQQLLLEKLMEAELEKNVAVAKAHFKAGLAFYRIRDYGHAMEKFLDSVTTVPSSLGYYYYAVAYNKLKELPERHDTAIMHLMLALDNTSNTLYYQNFRKMIWRTIGDIYLEMGNNDLARQAYQSSGMDDADSVEMLQ